MNLLPWGASLHTLGNYIYFNIYIIIIFMIMIIKVFIVYSTSYKCSTIYQECLKEKSHYCNSVKIAVTPLYLAVLYI